MQHARLTGKGQVTLVAYHFTSTVPLFSFCFLFLETKRRVL